MTIAFLLLCVGAIAFIALGASAAVGVGVRLADGWLSHLAPASRARLLLAAAAAPAFAGTATVVAWVVDIHVLGCTRHHCLVDHAAAGPAWLVLLLAGGMSARLLGTAGRVLRGMVRSRALRRSLISCEAERYGEARVLSFDEPQAFVLGLWHPELFISRGLLAAAQPGDLESVLAHERAHARRRDPLRRLLASVAFAFHLPGVAAVLEARLARAHEMAADAASAEAVGDAPRVAEVLVRLARLQLTPVPGAAAFSDNDLEARVRELLAEESRPDRPRAAALVVAAVWLFVATLIAADPIHAGAEALLRLLDH